LRNENEELWFEIATLQEGFEKDNSCMDPILEIFKEVTKIEEGKEGTMAIEPLLMNSQPA